MKFHNITLPNYYTGIKFETHEDIINNLKEDSTSLSFYKFKGPYTIDSMGLDFKKVMTIRYVFDHLHDTNLMIPCLIAYASKRSSKHATKET